MKEIVLIFRKPFPGQFSIEYLFYNISSSLRRQNTPITNHELDNYSKGLLNRAKNVVKLTSYKQKIVHVTGDVHYTLLGAWYSKRVLTIHDFGFMRNKGFLARNIYWLLWIYLPVKVSHKVTVVSEYTKKELLSYIKVNEDKVAVIGNFIDDIYQPAVKATQNIKPRLLQVGTAFNKNIERLLEAIKGIDCTLMITGILPPHLVELLEVNHIDYENKYNLSIEELYNEYEKSDLLCYVSTLEGFGMPILEAQATGVPVVCSNSSSMPEVAGDAALMVDPLDVNAIRAAIIEVLENSSTRERLIKAGLLNVKRYSKEEIAKEYLKLYHQL